HAHAHPELGFLKKYVFSADHKTIGIQFMFMGLAFMVVGGLLAMLVRWQLAYPTPDLQEKHPVPVLSRVLWAQFKSTEPLGTVKSVNADNRTVVVATGTTKDSAVGHKISVLDSSEKVVTTADVIDVGRDTVTARLPDKPADLPTK